MRYMIIAMLLAACSSDNPDCQVVTIPATPRVYPTVDRHYLQCGTNVVAVCWTEPQPTGFVVDGYYCEDQK